MKKVLLATILAATSMLAAQTIKGSDTVLPFSQRAAEAFMKADKTARVTVTGGGSGVGISALVD